MIKCIRCESKDGRPVFRTKPKGQTDAGWMCEECIHKDKKILNPPDDILEVTDVIDEPRFTNQRDTNFNIFLCPAIERQNRRRKDQT